MTIEQLEKAANRGDTDAQLRLGELYQRGVGVPKSDAAAVDWWKKAASRGNPKAQYNLGYAYQTGEGIAKDDAKAVEWYQKAAALGNGSAQYTMVNRFTTGTGVPKDVVIAYAWLNIAAASGNADRVKQRNEFEKQLTAEQKTKAEKLAVDFFAKMPNTNVEVDLSQQIVDPRQVLALQKELNAMGQLKEFMAAVSAENPMDPDFPGWIRNIKVKFHWAATSKEGDEFCQKIEKDAKPFQDRYRTAEQVLGYDELRDLAAYSRSTGKFLEIDMKEIDDALERAAAKKAK